MKKKVKRNDPCPCLSGKKFKKCHYLIKPEPVKRKKRSPRDAERALLQLSILANMGRQL